MQNMTADWTGNFSTSDVLDGPAFAGTSNGSGASDSFWTRWFDSKYPVQANGSVSVPTLNIYPSMSFSQNTTVRFLFAFYARSASGVNKTPSFDGFSMQMTNPRGVTDLQYSWSIDTSHTTKQSILFVEGTFRVTSSNLGMIQFQDLKASYSLDNISTPGTIQYMFGRGYLRYWRNDVSSDGTVLEQIRDNTQTTNDKIEEGNQIAEDTNKTTKNIFIAIRDFFASFFSNLINAVISLFVPSSSEMSGLFDQLNKFFSDRFGFLYAPFNYIIKLCNVFTSKTGTTALTFPGFSIMGYQVWPDIKYDIASDSLVGTICGYVRTGTGILLAGYFIMYLQNFFRERFGSE